MGAICVLQVERALFGGDSASSGAIYRALGRASLSTTPLSLRRASVPGLVTAEELSGLQRLLESTLDISARGRCKRVTLLAVNVCLSLARHLGRGPLTIKFIRTLHSPLPRAPPLPTA